jgi:Hpt domain
MQDAESNCPWSQGRKDETDVDGTNATSLNSDHGGLGEASAAGRENLLGLRNISLKGASATMHAGQTAALAGRVETAAKAGESTALEPLVEEVRAEVTRAIGYLRQAG